MIWLASFPRSGNTFFRNVLFEVYGLRSSTFHNESQYPLDPEYASFPVVKTHLLPSQLEPDDPSIPAVYLVRDGRDCVVSLAHYRKQLIDPNSDYRLNLQEAIDAAGGSHFGGWGRHVRRWLERASLVLHFEELIVDPVACLERLRPFLDLPEPDVRKVPTFSELQTKDFRYGSGSEHGFSPEQQRRWREGKFRRGRAGGWQDELPHDLHLRFLRLHGAELEQTGYITSPPMPMPPEPDTACPDPQPALIPKQQRAATQRVLIDGSKLLDNQIDGINRYVRELLMALHDVVTSDEPNWTIDVSLGYLGNYPLSVVVDDISLEKIAQQAIHPLWRHGKSNPIHRAVARIERSKQLGKKGITFHRLLLRYHRLHRSLLKRLFAIQRVMKRSNRSYDLLHLTLPNTWQQFQHTGLPLLTTVHDLSHLACPELQTPSNVKTLEKGLDFARRRGSAYLSVSKATKNQMVERLGIPECRVRVVHNAVCHERFRPEVDLHRLHEIRRKFNISSEPFLLCLGTIEPRKNLINTIRAFQQLMDSHPALPVQLILAGGTGWQRHEELRRIIRSEKRIRYIGYVDDADLPVLYSAADALCYASTYEGCGLPILEAMACGTPVIYGNNSSMPEIAEGCGLPVEAGDPRSIRDAMHRMVTDDALRKQFAVSSVLRARRFSWREAARRTLSVYRQAIQTNAQSVNLRSVSSGLFTSKAHSGHEGEQGKEGRRDAA